MTRNLQPIMILCRLDATGDPKNLQLTIDDARVKRINNKWTVKLEKGKLHTFCVPIIGDPALDPETVRSTFNNEGLVKWSAGEDGFLHTIDQLGELHIYVKTKAGGQAELPILNDGTGRPDLDFG